MQRRVFLLLAWMLAVPAMAKASVISVQGGPAVHLLPNTAGQTITLLISGDDFYQFGDFFALINGGVGPAPRVEAVFGDNFTTIPAGNLAGSVWAGGAAGIGSPPNGTTFDSPGLNPLVALFTAGQAVQNTAGIYMVLTVSTVGVPAGAYSMSFEGTTLSSGLDDNGDPIPVPLELPTIVFIPEPSTYVMAALGIVGLLFARRRK